MIGTASMISSADWNFATLMTINDYSGFEGFLYSTLLSLALVLPIIVGNVILFATTWPLARTSSATTRRRRWSST